MPLPQNKNRPTKDLPYRVWRYRWQLHGGHVHVGVFVANHPKVTFAKCGDLVMSPDDFSAFRAVFKGCQKTAFIEGGGAV